MRSGNMMKQTDARRSISHCRASEYEGDFMDNDGVSYGLVVSKFNDLITEKLLGGALSGLRKFGVDEESIDVSSNSMAVTCTNGICVSFRI